MKSLIKNILKEVQDYHNSVFLIMSDDEKFVKYNLHVGGENYFSGGPNNDGWESVDELNDKTFPEFYINQRTNAEGVISILPQRQLDTYKPKVVEYIMGFFRKGDDVSGVFDQLKEYKLTYKEIDPSKCYGIDLRNSGIDEKKEVLKRLESEFKSFVNFHEYTWVDQIKYLLTDFETPATLGPHTRSKCGRFFTTTDHFEYDPETKEHYVHVSMDGTKARWANEMSGREFLNMDLDTSGVFDQLNENKEEPKLDFGDYLYAIKPIFISSQKYYATRVGEIYEIHDIIYDGGVYKVVFANDQNDHHQVTPGSSFFNEHFIYVPKEEYDNLKNIDPFEKLYEQEDNQFDWIDKGGEEFGDEVLYTYLRTGDDIFFTTDGFRGCGFPDEYERGEIIKTNGTKFLVKTNNITHCTPRLENWSSDSSTMLDGLIYKCASDDIQEYEHSGRHNCIEIDGRTRSRYYMIRKREEK